MLSLSARVSRGPQKGRPLVLARNRRSKLVAVKDDHHANRDGEEAAARGVWPRGHGAWFSTDGRGAQARFHGPATRA